MFWSRLAAPALLVTAACSGSEATSATQKLLAPLELPAIATAPELAKPAAPPPEPWAPEEPALSYVFEVDHGIRADRGGKGHFLAPRAHGKHNGIDFLAPVGTPVLATCSGKAKADDRGGYGRVVQLVCQLPSSLAGEGAPYASFFYAHLDKTLVSRGKWVAVKAGQKLGTVGKTGNAKGAAIQPHLHLETIVRRTEADALAERHAGTVPAAAEVADDLVASLRSSCLEPAGFQPKGSELTRERRVDPFVLLTCGSKPKPALAAPGVPALDAAMIPWSQHYAATGFDVDRGPRLP